MAQMHDPEQLHHPILGPLRWNSTLSWWFADIKSPPIRDREIGIATVPNLEAHLDLAVDFLGWIESHAQEFLARAAYEALNYDLIWDDDLEETQLATQIAIQSVNVREGFVEVWLDTGGATTDHLLMAKLDSEHKIVGMEL